MAESIIQVTSGSGPKIHTWQRTIGANNVEDDFSLPGEYPLASYIASASAIGLAVANDHLIQIMAGASLNVRIRRIHISLWTLTTSSTLHRLELWRLSTAGTGGTAVTPAKLDNGDAAAGAAGMTLPTVKGTETTRLYSWGPAVVSAIASTQGGSVLDYIWTPNVKPPIIPAGAANGIVLKNISTQAAGAFTINVEFVETSFL